MDTKLPKVTIENEKYPIKDYKKMTFNFNKAEHQKIISLQSIIQMGDMAKMLIDTIFRTVILPRVGCSNSPDLGLEYDGVEGVFFVYVPRDLCKACKVNKAIYEKEGKKYCSKCLPK